MQVMEECSILSEVQEELHKKQYELEQSMIQPKKKKSSKQKIKN